MVQILERGGAVVVGFLVFLALFPAWGGDVDGTSGVDYSFFGNRVPTDDSRLAVAAGLVVLLVLWAAAALADSRRRSTNQTTSGASS